MIYYPPQQLMQFWYLILSFLQQEAKRSINHCNTTQMYTGWIKVFLHSHSLMSSLNPSNTLGFISISYPSSRLNLNFR